MIRNWCSISWNEVRDLLTTITNFLDKIPIVKGSALTAINWRRPSRTNPSISSRRFDDYIPVPIAIDHNRSSCPVEDVFI